MAGVPPPNTPPVPLPEQATDINVVRPAAPIYPPTVNNVLQAVAYRQDVSLSHDYAEAERCTEQDYYNAILYEHRVIGQAVAAADPQGAAPPWFQVALQAALQQIRAEIHGDMRQLLRAEVTPDLKRVTDGPRRDGTITPYEIVPFQHGDMPPAHLPELRSAAAINDLNAQQLDAYLIGYGVDPLPVGENQHATTRLRKDVLKKLIGASI